MFKDERLLGGLLRQRRQRGLPFNERTTDPTLKQGEMVDRTLMKGRSFDSSPIQGRDRVDTYTGERATRHLYTERQPIPD